MSDTAKVHAFTDASGNRWTLRITTDEIRSVSNTLGVRLDKLIENENKPLGELLSDYLRLGDVLWVLCEDQAAKKNLSVKDFASGLQGDAINDAAIAFVRALAVFFPSQSQRNLILAILKKATQINAEMEKRTTKVLDQIDAMDMGQMLDKMDEAPTPLDSIVSANVTVSAESPELIQAHAH